MEQNNISREDLGDELNLREIQLCLLDMLTAFSNFCEKHNLRYYISGGTLLGAARHNGFIPWDDDIDVNMPRPDYERLLNLAKNGIEKYQVYESPKCYISYAKMFDPDTVMLNEYEGVSGKKASSYYESVFMDICPLDGLPKNELLFKIHSGAYQILAGMRGTLFHGFFGSTKAKKVFRIITYPLATVLGADRLEQMEKHLATKYKYEDSDYIGAIVTKNRMKDRLLKSEYEPRIKISFENREFYATQMYMKHLHILYGKDCMQIPKKEDQKSVHICRVWKLKLRSESK